MAEEQGIQLQTLALKIKEIYNKVSVHIGAFTLIAEDVTESYLQEIERLRAERDRLAASWVVGTDGERYCPDIILPYLGVTLDKISANVKGAKPGFMDSRSRYQLNLSAEALTLADTEKAAEDYHLLVQNFFDLQKTVTGLNDLQTNVSSVPEYKRVCEYTICLLDGIASKIFGTKIVTPANFDVKEQMPHQLLGEINVGFEHFLPALVSKIAHEGPFGHSTNNLLANPQFPFWFSHTGEGLAILGERLALEALYENKPELVEIMLAQRRMHDAMGAAFERAAFYDCMPVADIADLLDNKRTPKQLLKQQLSGLEATREARFNLGATIYYVGGKLVPPFILLRWLRLSQRETLILKPQF